MTAILLQLAEQEKLANLFFHINHVLVPPAIDAVMHDPNARVNAFIGPAHVSVISGAKIYRPAVEQYGTPVVVSGFEPVDVMESILRIVRQKAAGKAELDIQYSRAVSEQGNLAAQAKVEQFFQIRPQFRWRGLGPIPNSPKDCKVFGRGCNPETPLGSCMVSSEGACNAYYRYQGIDSKEQHHG